LPEPLNDYKWLRGQDHYGSFLASGRSGHGALGWYYPEKAATSCNACHMQAVPSDDFAARDRDGSGVRSVLSHAFPSANTALSAVIDQSACAMLPGVACAELPPSFASETAEQAHEAIVAGHAAFNAKTVRVDLFAVRDGGAIDGALRVIGGELPVLDAGKSYLLEVVVRTLDIGHEFTQGTADSNEVWLWTRATLDDAGTAERIVGVSGALDTATGALDPWSRKFNAFVIDRDGNRVDRRNPQDIFLPLYNNQIPPGAGDVTHFQLSVPEDAAAPLRLETEVRYRKFDTTYLRYVFGDARVNDLPVLVLARDEVLLPVRASDGRVHGAVAGAADAVPEMQRWYDYGIGLFRESDRGTGRGALRQADEAFARVSEMDAALGALARARLAVREGRLDDASRALGQAAAAGSKIPWTVAYFTALVDKQNGNFAKAAEGFRRVLTTDFAGARERGFDFSRDVRVQNELAETLLESALAANGDDARLALAREALTVARQSLDIDPEQAQAWWFVNRACEMLGDANGAKSARDEHARYKPDENARDRAVRLAREKYPWADAAAEATVIYSLSK